MLPKLNKSLGLFRMSSYANNMHQFWKKDAASVHPDWDRFFSTNGNVVESKGSIPDERTKQLVISTYFLIRYYRMRGHELATLDPLNLKNYQEFGKIYVKNPLQLDLKNNKVLNDTDLDIPFKFPSQKIFSEEISGFLEQRSQWTLREVHNRLKQIYCGSIGLQSMHISNYEQKKWLMKQFEVLSVKKSNRDQKIKILKQLINVESFNYFLNDKLKTSKRFGVEGLCSMIVGLNKLVQTATQNGIQYIGFGMAHRGRLNALANVFDKPLQKIFAEFQENTDEEETQNWGNSGDVKYHLGVTVEKNVNNKGVRLSILPNPSHLETVNPVCMGHVKAVEDHFQQDKKTLSVLIHGDAALAGQGVVYECLQMAYLNHYHNHGVIHIVANNQIGFTTTPAQARTGLYCTDVAKSIQAPIIHVNADEPELVNQAMRMAVQYREKFHKDIFVDIIGYRRYGHNEQDQPAFTQPMMYQEIGKRPNIYNLYKQKLTAQNLLSESQAKQFWDQRLSKINEAYVESQKEAFDIKKWKVPSYHRVVDFSDLGQINNTGVEQEALKSVGAEITKVPSTFTPHSSIKKIYDIRSQAIQSGETIDFALGQALAFATLLKQGFNVRLSGQDVERGTFSHRHAVIVDQNNQSKYTPLFNLLSEGERKRFQVQNSFLSEYAALGFEYGYSMTNPNTLTIWEAQFGDFANGAQIIIDNYLASGESKWNVQNGLVMNLPHGMDGQGPEHSSARVQRYLQLVNESWVNIAEERAKGDEYQPLRNTNLHVICCSNAANLFHAYRRQLRRDFRKPLINLMNKKLLKSKQSSSPLSDLSLHSFRTIIGQVDHEIKPQAVKKVVYVTGQAYFSALQKRKELQRKDVALIRIEQLAPFHYSEFKNIVKQFKNATQHIWFQEEHRNSGAWNYLSPRFNHILEEMHKEGLIKSSGINCVSRRNSASPAVGKKRKHDQEQIEILSKLFA